MRELIIRLYKYSELSDKAKDNARMWWVITESEHPAWIDDRFKSMQEVIKNINIMPRSLFIKKCENLELTGYCADDLILNLLKLNSNPTEKNIRDFYQIEWDREFESAMNNREYIESCIIMNEYEFKEDGTKWRD